MILDGLARYLDAQHAGLTWDDTSDTGNVFVETMPQTPDTAVALFGYGGPEPDSKLGYDTPSVQVRVRGGRDPRTSRTLAQEIYDLLHGLGITTLPDGTVLISCEAIQSPTTLGQDGNQRHEHVVNFRCEIRNTAGHRA